MIYLQETDCLSKQNIRISPRFKNYTNFICQDTCWIQMSIFLNPDLSYSDELHLDRKWDFIPGKSIYSSIKNCYGYKNNHQLKKRYKSVTAFSLSNADFLTLISLSSCNLYSDCICVPFYKSIHNYFIKPTLKPF